MKVIIADRNKIEHKDLTNMYRNFFLHSPEGEIVLQDLAGKSGMFAVSTKSEDLMFKEGMRALFMYISSHLQDDMESEEDFTPIEPFKYS